LSLDRIFNPVGLEPGTNQLMTEEKYKTKVSMG